MTDDALFIAGSAVTGTLALAGFGLDAPVHLHLQTVAVVGAGVFWRARVGTEGEWQYSRRLKDATCRAVAAFMEGLCTSQSQE